jgi:hypothetical protein
VRLSKAPTSDPDSSIRPRSPFYRKGVTGVGFTISAAAQNLRNAGYYELCSMQSRRGISTDMSACGQFSRTELDWLVGMSHGRFPLLIMSAKVKIARIWRVEMQPVPQFVGCMQAVLTL